MPGDAPQTNPSVRRERAVGGLLALALDEAASDSPYEAGREIARGGMGAVLDARDNKLGRSVAMKVMLRRNASEEEQQRFLQEARVLGQLAHPNIVPVHDVGTDEQGRLFYTMKLVQGVTLHDVIGKLKAGDKDTLARYPLNALLTIFQKVCDAVAFAHSRGIIHRDLKPQNIMVGEFGEVLVMDWGLAKILPGSSAAEEAAKTPLLRGELGQTGPTGTLPLGGGAAGSDERQVVPTGVEDQATIASTPAAAEQATVASGTGSASAPKLTFGSQQPEPATPSGMYATMEGAVMGTPNYMSPEQAEGRIGELDARSDIFSLGGILYALLTLRPPVEGESVEEILSKVSSAAIAPPTDFNAPGSPTHGTAATTGGVTEPRKIHPLLHCPGGKVPAALSAVTMKALTRDKSRRYQTVAEFTRDIAAYQGGFATSAENADALMQLRLLIARHRVLSSAAAVIVLLTAFFITRLSNERDVAQANEALARRNADKARAAEQVAEQKSDVANRALARSQVSLAEAAYRELDSRAMRAALDGVPADLRDGDWRYLDTRTDNSLAKLVHPAKALFGGVAGHPTQPGVFAVAATDRTISFIEAATGRRISSFPMSPRQQRTIFYRTLDFSPDGARLLVGALEAAAGVAIYDAITGKPLVEWDGSGVDLVRFNADGTRTLDLTVRGDLSIREAANGRALWSAKQVRRAVFTPAGDLLAATANGLQLLNGTNGALVKQFPDGRTDVVSLVLTRDGKTLLLGNADGSVRGLRMPEGTVAFERPLTEGRSSPRLALSADGQRVAVAAALPGGQRIARWWEAGSGQPVQSLFGSVGPMEALAVHPLSGEIIIIGHDTRVWQFTTRPPQWQFNGSVRAAVFWGADDVFIPLGTPVKLGAWNQSSLLPVNLPPEASGAFHAAAGGEVVVLAKQLANPNPACVALVLRKTPAGFQFAHSFTCPGYLVQVRLSPDGQRLAVLDYYWTITLFDTTTGKQLPTCERAGLQNCWDFGWLDRDHLVGVGTKGARGGVDTDERVVLWDANTGRALRIVRHETSLDRLAIAPGGRSFAEGGADKRIRIRDAKTLEVTREFRAHDGRISALAFHPTKPILASGSGDLTVRLWNLDDFSLREEIRPWPVEPVSLEFSPTGTRLASANVVGGVSIWDFTAPAVTPVRLAPDPTPPASGPQPPLTVARAHARAGRWAEARTALVEAVRLAPSDSMASMHLAVVLAQLGDRAAYRAHGHALLGVFKYAARPEELERAAKSALLLPLDGMAAADRDTAFQLAQKAVTVGANSGLQLYFQFAQALAQYRAGNHSSAVATLDRLSKGDNELLAGTSLCVLALAQRGLGRHAEAQATLARAEAFAAGKLPKPDATDLGGAWNDVVITRLLLREAREVMGKN